MKQKILIAHAKGEEALAEELAAPLIKEGYEPIHINSIEIGAGVIEEYTRHLTDKTPILLCATFKAVASKWARQLVNAARHIPGARMFALQMDEEVYMEQLTLDEKYGKYWENPTQTMNELIEVLRKYYPIDGSINSGVIIQAALNNYYAEIRKRYQRLDLDSLTPRQKSDYLEIQLRSVYVEQNVRENPPPVDFPPEILKRLQKNNEFEQGELPEDIALEDVKRVSDVYYKKPPRPVLDILSDVINQHVVILGDPGSGKSTLTRFIILSLIDPTQDSKIGNAFPDYLPLLIELKSYIDLIKKNDKYKNFIDYFEYLKQTQGYYFERETLHTYLKTTGKAIVIFDGLDEIFEPQERDQVCRHIDNFKETYPGTRIIVTSRIIGFRRKILTDTGFRIFTLQDLDQPQIKEFVEKWFSIALYDRNEEFTMERCNLIMAAVKDSASLRQLAGNPLLLTIMSILSKNQELPRERWKLYDHAAQVLIEIWDVNKHLETNKLKSKYIDEDDKREMLQKIAFKMQEGEGVAAGNYIIEKELQNEFEKYIVERYREQPGTAKLIAQNMIFQLRERNFILSQYGAKLYGFVHRAFLEYFCALYFLHDFKNTHKTSLEQLKTDIFGKHCQDQSWHEVLRLVCGMIEPEFAGSVIDFLSQQNTQKLEAPKYDQNLLNLALAIKCFSEVKKMHLLVKPANNLLYSICLAFDGDMLLPPDFFLFFKQNILPLAKLIGPSWPDKDFLATILRERKSESPSYSHAYIYDNLFGSFIGYIGNGSKEVHKALLEYAHDENPNIRVSAPFALAVGWKDDPNTYPLLCKLADGDPHQTVCYAAIYALAEHYSDRPQTYRLLVKNVKYSVHDFGRVAAITALAAHFHTKEGVFELIKERFLHEPHKYPRTVAIKALGEWFTHFESTYELLLDAALHDESPKPGDTEYKDPRYVRDAALEAIVQNWPNHENTIQLLHVCSKNDPTPWLRKRAADMLKTVKANKIL